jgi:hypothetical protein
MTLVVDAVILSPTANSYVSVGEADTYVADQVSDASVGATWQALSPELKALYVVRATEFLDSLVSWNGDRWSLTQNLKWPRFNVFVDGYYLQIGLVAPPKVKYATVELALFLMQQSNATSEANTNVLYNAVTVGPLKIDFNNVGTGPANKFFPDIVAILIKDLGIIDNPDLPNTNRLKQVKLTRA